MNYELYITVGYAMVKKLQFFLQTHERHTAYFSKGLHWQSLVIMHHMKCIHNIQSLPVQDYRYNNINIHTHKYTHICLCLSNWPCHEKTCFY